MGPLFGGASSMFNTHPWVAVGAIAGIILGAVLYSGNFTYALIGAIVGGIIGYAAESLMKRKPPA